MVKFSEVKAYITKPVKPLVKPSFYEKYITDKNALSQGLEQGKYVKGRLFFDYLSEKKDRFEIGFVKAEGIDMPIKVWGLRNLNRSLHMDEVYLKFVQWIDWGKASVK